MFLEMLLFATLSRLHLNPINMRYIRMLSLQSFPDLDELVAIGKIIYSQVLVTGEGFPVSSNRIFNIGSLNYMKKYYRKHPNAFLEMSPKLRVRYSLLGMTHALIPKLFCAQPRDRKSFYVHSKILLRVIERMITPIVRIQRSGNQGSFSYFNYKCLRVEVTLDLSQIRQGAMYISDEHDHRYKNLSLNKFAIMFVNANPHFSNLTIDFKQFLRLIDWAVNKNIALRNYDASFFGVYYVNLSKIGWENYPSDMLLYKANKNGMLSQAIREFISYKMEKFNNQVSE